MSFESSKIAMIGRAELHDLDLAYQIYNRLDAEVIERIEKSNIHFWILSEMFKECLQSKNDFSSEVSRCLDDANYVCSKLKDYERTHK